MAEEEEKAGRIFVGPEKMNSAASHGDNISSPNISNLHQNETKEESQVSGTPSSSSSDKIDSTKGMNKGKSCKGCLYYSSSFKSNSRNPLCVGIPRPLPIVPRYIISESEMDASKEGRSLTDFKYGCVGYSVYVDRKGLPPDGKETPTELPVCVGLEVLMDRRVNAAAPAPAHVYNKEDAAGISHPRPPPPPPRKPAQPVGDEFLTRFKRNANLVAMGVAKNMRRVGNRVKESVDDILYPYRRRPK